MPFEAIAKQLPKIDIISAFRDITKENDVQKWILDTIRNRIQSSGVVGTGQELRTDMSIIEGLGEKYADYTINLKNRFGSGIGRITDHVTLTQNGDFFRTFRILIKNDGYEVKADFLKNDGYISANFGMSFSSRNQFEDAVESLTETELISLVNNYYYPKYIKKLNEIL